VKAAAHVVVGLVAGAVFAVGLALAGMTDPHKVAGFLDVSGAWDPSLAFVMIGAIGVFLPLHAIAKRRARPLLAERFSAPERTGIDARLVVGAAIFGLGWGAAGYCPGPGLVSLSTGGLGPIAFVGGMAVGMAVFRAALGRKSTMTDGRVAAPRVDAEVAPLGDSA
jgi:uncharacterized membrane protein YedE/YeeE